VLLVALLASAGTSLGRSHACNNTITSRLLADPACQQQAPDQAGLVSPLREQVLNKLHVSYLHTPLSLLEECSLDPQELALYLNNSRVYIQTTAVSTDVKHFLASCIA